MTFTEAAAEVLRIAGKPLHYKEITELAIEKNLLSHVGKSPEVTMGARLAALLKKEDKENPIVRVKPGVFALREWEGKKGGRGAGRGGRGGAKEEEPNANANADDAEAENDEGVEVNALDIEAGARSARSEESAGADSEKAPPVEVTGEEKLRRDLAASGAELFDDEDDDDQPILSSPQSSNDVAGGAAGANGQPGEGGRRRRRRRRRRGGREGGEERASSPRVNGEGGAAASQPNASAAVGEPRDVDSSVDTSRDPLAPAPRPMIRDRQQIMQGGTPTGIDIPPGEVEELAGKELADATIMILSGFDRQQGPVQVRAVVDALMRRGKLTGDMAVATAQLMASLRADNIRRNATGLRPRFRFATGPRVALTDWSLPNDLVRLEQEAMAAVERFREASRRTMLRKLQELPGHALLELVLLGLERVGMSNVRTVRRAGASGGEAHFGAAHRTGTDEIRTAIVLRKDGREIGRERVSDLRGALHHYGPASSGWLLTTGQVLSGAREEAAAPGAPPITLFDGVAVCKLLEEGDVGVIRTRLTTAIPDLELYDTLRGL